MSEKRSLRHSSRRHLLGGLAVGAGAFAATRSQADTQDGHAAGYDVAPASERMASVPRRTGDPLTFTASLDRAALKSTSGGWAREITARQLPIATDIAGAHLFINPGGLREMHWHRSAEWAYILGGHCQITVVDPAGETEVANYGPGDLWFFPEGHAHAILAFNDGLYGEHGTFGITDWMSRHEPAMLAQALGIPLESFRGFPSGKTYIMQGPVLAEESQEASIVQELGLRRTHRHRLIDQPALVDALGGAIHVASATEFPISRNMTGVVTRLQPGAMHTLHWHPDANEWRYVAKGRTRVILLGFDKRMAVAELSAGDCAYLPRACGHSIQNIGAEPCEIVGVLGSGTYTEATLVAWLARAPRHLLAANFGIPDAQLARWGAGGRILSQL